MNMITCRDLTKRFKTVDGRVAGMDGVTLDVARGEWLVLRGPSGSGKTTLLLTLGGMLRPDSGTVTVGGVDPYQVSAEARAAIRARSIGFVFQLFHLVPYLTVRQNILAGMDRRDAEIEARADALLEELGLGTRRDAMPGTLSAGERQRVALARALAKKPDVILADEPTGNLDPENARIVFERLERFRRDQGTVLMVTHGADAERYGTRTLHLVSGKLATDGARDGGTEPVRRTGMSWMRTVALALGLSGGLAVQATDWPTYRGDYARSGVSPDALPSKPVETWKWKSAHPPQPAWQGEAKWDGWNKVFDLKPRQIFDRAFHAVVVGDRVLFGSSSDDQVRCLEAGTGRVLWTFYTEGPVRLAPSVKDGKAYFGSDDGHVYCVGVADGKQVWKARGTPKDRRIPGNGRLVSVWPVRTSVVVQDGTVYTTAGMFPAEGVHRIALDAATGAERWRQIQTDLPAQGYLLASRTRLYVPAGRDNPAVCDVADGKRLRVVEGAGGTYALLTDDMLVFGPGKTGQLGAVEEGRSDQLATFQGNHMIVTLDRSYLHSDTEITALDRARYLQLARERRRLVGEQAALSKKLKQGAKAGVTDADRAGLKTQLAEIGQKIDAATTGMDRCQLWKAPSEWQNCLVLAGDTLVVGGRNEVAGIQVRDGAVAWRLPVDGVAYGIAAANGAFYVSTDTGTIHRFAASGTRAQSGAGGNNGGQP